MIEKENYNKKIHRNASKNKYLNSKSEIKSKPKTYNDIPDKIISKKTQSKKRKFIETFINCPKTTILDLVRKQKLDNNKKKGKKTTRNSICHQKVNISMAKSARLPKMTVCLNEADISNDTITKEMEFNNFEENEINEELNYQIKNVENDFNLAMNSINEKFSNIK